MLAGINSALLSESGNGRHVHAYAWPRLSIQTYGKHYRVYLN